MSEKEFPRKLVRRCVRHITGGSIFTPEERAEIVQNILRESGHADLVKMLQDARAFIERGYSDEDAQIERIDAALCKAGV